MTTPAPTTARRKPARRSAMLARGMQLDQVPPESRRKAACVLEVLAGLRTPEEAAGALGVSLPSYYNLETRALRGLVHGCTPEPPGRKLALQKRLRDSQTQCADLEREVQRYRALLRSAQRSMGLAPPAAGAAKGKTGACARRPRKPRVRAIRAIEALDGVATDGPPPAA